MGEALAPELKELLDKAKEALASQKKTEETLNEIKAWGAENGRVKQAEDAIKQLEEWRKGLSSEIDEKVRSASRRAYSENGQYRGHFAGEDEARTFALQTVMATAGAKNTSLLKRCREILDTDHKDYIEGRKDIDGDDAIVGHEHSTRIIRLVEDYGSFVGEAYPMPMSSDTLSFSRRVSGMRAHKTKRRNAVDKQNMALAPVNLTADDWDVLTSYPMDLADDALVSVAELLLEEMSFGFSVALDEDGFIGDGTDDYDNEVGLVTLLSNTNGVDDGGGLVLGSGGTGTGWAGIGKDDLLKMMGQARYVRPGMGKYYCSQEFYFQRVAKLVTDAGGTLMREIEGRPSFQIFGAPCQLTPVMPRSSGHSQIPILYGDIRQSSTVGHRKRMTLRQSDHVYFASKEVGVMLSGRWAINHHSYGDATTAGPIVGAITPASGG